MFEPALLNQIREKFHHVDACPYQGSRAFFENAGGSLKLKTVVETGERLSAIPDNQGRSNVASRALVDLIEQGRRDMMAFFGVEEGAVFVGESGTELLFRLVRAAAVGSTSGGAIIGSTLEHPATASAGRQWSEITGKTFIRVPHDIETATITAEAYQPHVTPDTRVATIIQTSPVTGMSVDVKAVARTIRAVAPSCFIIVDGIQHAAHGVLSVADYDVDAFTVSGYKMYSRHNYGVAWVSPRMSRLKHERLDGTAEDHWELGTRDTAAYATFSDVVNYLEWLGATFTDVSDRRARLIKAGEVMQAQEAALVDRMIEGNGDLVGLRGLPGVKVIGGCDNPHREGLVSFAADGVPSSTIVDRLNEAGVRTHVRKDDHFSGNILKPLALKDCVRVSLCHYNSADEVDRFLSAMGEILSAVNVAASVA